MFARLRVVLVCAAVLGFAGCGPPKLEDTGTKTIEAMDYMLRGLPKVGQPQKVTIDVDATEPINVFVQMPSISAVRFRSPPQ